MADGLLPPVLARLSLEISNSSFERAKRKVVSKVGSVGRYDRFDDDVADAVFLRIQQNCQVGRYANEDDLMASRPGSCRLEGEGSIVLYRASPPGTGIRPGDFAAGSRDEAGYYTHGGHTIQKMTVPRRDVIAVPGAVGTGQEYVLLPEGYVPPVPQVWFADFHSFWSAARGFEPVPVADIEPDPVLGMSR